MFIMAVLLSFILPLGYLVVRIVSHGGGTEEVRSREDYVLMLLQCLLGIAAIVLPLRLIRQKTLQIPRVMLVLYIAFLYCAIFLGEVRSFYYAVPQWDTILHTMSGAMLGALGFSMIAIFNNAERIPLNLSPVFIALFAFCFALAMGAVWEIYEFTMDSVFGTNMQKYMLERARKHRDAHTYVAHNMEELKDIADNKPGFIKAMWCGDQACEDKIKEETTATSRCMPFEQEHLSDVCVCCGRPAKKMVYWGKAY